MTHIRHEQPIGFLPVKTTTPPGPPPALTASLDGGRDGIADRDHVPFLDKWGGSLGGPAKTAATNKCLARNNKSQDAGKSDKETAAQSKLETGRGTPPLGSAPDAERRR